MVYGEALILYYHDGEALMLYYGVWRGIHIILWRGIHIILWRGIHIILWRGINNNIIIIHTFSIALFPTVDFKE